MSNKRESRKVRAAPYRSPMLGAAPPAPIAYLRFSNSRGTTTSAFQRATETNIPAWARSCKPALYPDSLWRRNWPNSRKVLALAEKLWSAR
jgi:hypothetical protein